MPSVSKAGGYSYPRRSVSARIYWRDSGQAHVIIDYAWNEAGDEHQREAVLLKHRFSGKPRKMGDALQALAWAIAKAAGETDLGRDVS